ncbi:unnamed protein product [Absidia cylindrospora]
MLRVISKASVTRRTPAMIQSGVRPFSATVTKKEEIEVFVDGKSVMIEQGAALIQACEKAGADVSMCSVMDR